MKQHTHITENNVQMTVTDLATTVSQAEIVEQINLISEISRQIVGINHVDELCHMIVGLIQNSLEYDFVGIWMVNPNTSSIELKAMSGSLVSMSESFKLTVEDDNQLIVRTWQTGDSHLIEDFYRTRLKLCYGTGYKPRTVFALPIFNLNDTIAVLEIHRYLANSLNFTDTFALEILVSQIAATLRNALLFEELETAKEEAEIANRLKSQFLASMSHSLRNPLNAILHWLEFMINGFMGKLNAEQISVLKMMVSNGEHLLGLLNDGLDISRVKIGQGELFVEPLDITSILYNARSVLLDYVRKKPIRVIMEIERDIPEIHGDQRRLNQIFLYLATYSARSITDGTVTMRAYHEAGSVFASINTLGNSVSLHHATDKPKDVEHRNTPYGDSRFSLPITKYFIALHGGRIWFERENETNITYYIQLKGIVEDAPQTADNN